MAKGIFKYARARVGTQSVRAAFLNLHCCCGHLCKAPRRPNFSWHILIFYFSLEGRIHYSYVPPKHYPYAFITWSQWAIAGEQGLP